MATAPMTDFGENVVYAEEVYLDTSLGTAAGVYTASVQIPAKATIDDVKIVGVALWNAGTSATGKVGDATDDDGFYTGINLKATDLLAGEVLSFKGMGGKEGAYYVTSEWASLYSTSSRVITLTITTVGTAPTTGETRMIVSFTLPTAQKPAKIGSYVAT